MQKPVTIKTIAKEMKLSVSAVSKALNDYSDINPETKERVLKKAAEMGYSPNLMARSLVKRTSNFVGIVIRDVASVYGEMFKALHDAARARGLNVILYDTNRDAEQERVCVQNLIDTMALGIVAAPVSGDISGIKRLCRGRAPVVYLGGRVTDERENFVASDGEAGARMALDHLAEQGHRGIALVCDSLNTASRASKLSAYQEKMRALGQTEMIFSDAKSDDLIAAGYRQGQKMLASGRRITAVFVSKDRMAIGVMQAVREAGLRIPEDISVIGYDGIEAAALPMIGLTTVAQPREEMAEKIMDILVRHAENDTLPPEHFFARPVLTVRKSCGIAYDFQQKKFCEKYEGGDQT